MLNCKTPIISSNICRQCQLICRFLRKERKVSTFLYLPGTEEEDLNFRNRYTQITSVSELGVRDLQGGRNRRPELLGDKLQIYEYDEKRLQIPRNNLRADIQKSVVKMALDIAHYGCPLRQNSLVLDLGCGIDVQALYAPYCNSRFVIGMDVAVNWKQMAKDNIPGTLFDVIQSDMKNHFPFRTCVFDTVLSVSALQWLFIRSSAPLLLDVFFRSVSSVLRHGGTGTVQFYPRNTQDVHNVIAAAGVYFKGALIADYPHPDRGKKLFLSLSKVD
ncbi:hypothetical protein SNE40_016022 [Patella caerulea]|uniref:Methyltransferase type 11 domain-containing protein n=1 Tax=Patella caerulea TaxID=87958 RepID=A0AAN8PBD4_PATCE